jgi:hypothetical protein
MARFFHGQGQEWTQWTSWTQMDTSLWTEWTHTAGGIFEPVHSSIKRKVHRVHSTHPYPFVSLSMKMNENALKNAVSENF